MSMNKYCPSCGEKKACGQHHIYAIELKPEVLEDPGFRKLAGVEDNFEGQCFYVGQTFHQVTCRYGQHKARKARRRRKGSTFSCTCKTGLVEEEPFTKYNKGNTFVRKYSIGLRPEFFRDKNPVYGGKEAAERAEMDLAEELRSKGFAVHFA
jgi:hypothetical protein